MRYLRPCHVCESLSMLAPTCVVVPTIMKVTEGGYIVSTPEEHYLHRPHLRHRDLCRYILLSPKASHAMGYHHHHAKIRLSKTCPHALPPPKTP